jgi:hypothetical protein
MLAQLLDHDDTPTEDHIVVLHDVSWVDYERVLAMRGDVSVPRLNYVEGELELMTPSWPRESIGVKEVWFWRRGRISVHVLEGNGYVDSASSRALPGIDLVQLASYLDRETDSQAIREYRAAVLANKPD